MAVLTAAFCQQLPFGVWLYPDETVRRAEFTKLFSGLIAAPHVLIEVTEDLRSVALWEPPTAAKRAADGSGSHTASDAPADPMSAEAAKLFADVDAAKPVLDEAGSPGWYLAFLGSQERGGGSALIRHRLAAIGAAPASLWTPNEELLPFYGRFGFVLRSRHEAPGAAAFWMVRGPGQLPAD